MGFRHGDTKLRAIQTPITSLGKQMMEHVKTNLLPCTQNRHHFIFSSAQTARKGLLHLQCNVVQRKTPLRAPWGCAVKQPKAREVKHMKLPSTRQLGWPLDILWSCITELEGLVECLLLMVGERIPEALMFQCFPEAFLCSSALKSHFLRVRVVTLLSRSATNSPRVPHRKQELVTQQERSSVKIPSGTHAPGSLARCWLQNFTWSL